ncbi:hypothetical protein G6F23_012857 [Rhizopus arrhizus]|nr:hypothetical protein G6F23_012857 [Rhizopus arrhizus]
MLAFVSSENTTRRQSSVVQFWYFLDRASRIFMCFAVNKGYLALIAEKKFIDFNTFIAVLLELALYNLKFDEFLRLSGHNDWSTTKPTLSVRETFVRIVINCYIRNPKAVYNIHKDFSGK